MTDGVSRTFDQVLTRIAERARAHDEGAIWPADDFADLAEIGVLKWAAATKWGGQDMPALDMHRNYEKLAGASLPTAHILYLRDLAVSLIESSSEETLAAEILPAAVAGKVWVTGAVSHLVLDDSLSAGTLRAVPNGNDFKIAGKLPWVSSAKQSDWIVAGTMLENQKQMIFAFPRDHAGTTTHGPIKTVAMQASQTCEIHFDNVKIPRKWVLIDAGDKVLRRRRKVLPAGQSFLALGHARAALELIRAHPGRHALDTYDTMELQYHRLHEGLLQSVDQIDEHDLQTGPILRGESISLAARASLAAVAVYRGSGVRMDHPAQRLAREALFLLVWWSPTAVLDRTLELFSTPA